MGKQRTAPTNSKIAPTPRPAGNQRGKVTPKQAGQRPTPVAPKFDLTTITQEYERRRQIHQTYMNTKLLAIDNYAVGRRGTDYLTILGPDNSNLIYQVQDQTIPNLIEKTIAYNTPDSVQVSIPLELNPLSTDADREAMASVIETHWDNEALYSEGDPWYERQWAFMVRGNCFKYFQWLDPDMADDLQDGWPIRSTQFDLFESAIMRGPNGRVDSAIFQRKVYGSDLPSAEFKKLGADASLSTEYEMSLYVDRVQWGRVVSEIITQPLVPHGLYASDQITPMCPVAVGMHRPQVIRNGSVAPQVSGFSQIGRKIGIPPVYYLLASSEILSRTQTVQMENIRRVGMATIYEKGRVKRPNDTGLDLTEVSIELDDKGEIGFLTPPDVNHNADNFNSNIRNNFSGPAGMDNSMLSGPQQQATSGVAANHTTTFPRAYAQQLSITLAHMLEQEAHIIAGICASKLQASALDAVQHEHGERLPTVGGVNDPLAQGTVIFTPQTAGEPVTELTWAGFRRAKVTVTPDTRMTPEGKMQVGMQALLAKDPQTGRTVLPLPVILTKFFDGIFDSPEEIERAIQLDEVASQPGSPLKVIEQVGAVINRFAAYVGENQAGQMRDSLTQYMQTTLPNFVQQMLAAPTQQPGQPSLGNQGQPPPPPPPGNGPPQGQPPPPGPPQQAGPVLPGQVPMIQPPGSPMAVPPGPMQAGGGNPAAAMPQQPPPQQGNPYG